MSALTSQRRVENFGPFHLKFPFGVATNVVLWKGGLVAKNSGGFLVPATATAGLLVAGIINPGANHDRVDTTAAGPDGLLADGVKIGHVEIGVFGFLNSGTDPVTVADLLNDVFVADNQTIRRTDGAVGSPIAGQLVGFDTNPTVALVAIGFRFPGKPGASAAETFVAQDQVTASGAVSLLTRCTRVSVTGTTAYTLADGLYLGQRKILRCTVAATTPHGVLTPAHANTFTSVEFNVVGQSVILEWNGTAWDLVSTSGVPTVV